MENPIGGGCSMVLILLLGLIVGGLLLFGITIDESGPSISQPTPDVIVITMPPIEIPTAAPTLIIIPTPTAE